MPERATFTMVYLHPAPPIPGANQPVGRFCTYECQDCKQLGIEHQVVMVPGPPTDKRSDWGANVPTTMRECTACRRQDGPWVSSEIVGGGW